MMLAERLTEYEKRTDAVVVALPRGGVPAASEVSQRLELPLAILADREAGTLHEEGLPERERADRSDGVSLPIEGKTVIVVDDGATTGSTLLAAIESMRLQGVASVIVAIPVASPSAISLLCRHADDVYCVLVPRSFSSVEEWYGDSGRAGNRDVGGLLRESSAGRRTEIRPA